VGISEESPRACDSVCKLRSKESSVAISLIECHFSSSSFQSHEVSHSSSAFSDLLEEDIVTIPVV
jgi:hypothetical protein